MSKYIVWRNQGYGNWSKSDEFDTIDECFEYLKAYNMGEDYLVTKVVNVVFSEGEES